MDNRPKNVKLVLTVNRNLEPMDITNLIIGLFMIGIGFLVKSFPNLIAGYNTMPQYEKENVDIDGLSTFMRTGFIIIGLTMIIGYYLFKSIGFIAIANLVAPIVILIGVTIMVIYAQRFYHGMNSGKKTTQKYLVVGVVLVFVIGSTAYGYIPSKTNISDNTIQFTGMYGFDLNVSDIENIELANEIPEINRRTNGYSLGSVKKGIFNLEKFGRTRLLLESDKPPYLIISKNDGDKIIVNYKNSSETKEMYNQIKPLINE